MKLKWMLMMFLLMGLMASSAYAEAESSGGNHGVMSTIGNFLKAPFDKAGDSLANGERISSNEDVAVSDVYNLDAETSG